jgi:hypothetical protein
MGGMPLSMFWDQVNAELEVPCSAIPYEQWHELAMASMNQVGDKHPLWPVQHFVGRLGTPKTNDMAHSDIQEISLAVRSSVRYLIRSGFIQSSVAGFGGPVDGAIKRQTFPL